MDKQQAARKSKATENKSLSLMQFEIDILQKIARDGSPNKEATRIIRQCLIERLNNGSKL